MAGRRSKRRTDYMSNDLTVFDFADSARPAACARIKKGAAHSTIKEVKAMSGGAAAMKTIEDEELSWFDKDLDDFDIPLQVGGGEEEEEEEEDADTPQTGSGRTRHRSKQGQRSAEHKSGRVYPVDLWYLLADHVHPEAVHKFAAICRDAYLTTHTGQFWRHLYRRYYSKDKELPVDLKMTALERNHGLRARCVRALYVLVPSLSQRVQPKGPFDTDPHKLVGYRCLLVWHQPSHGKWNFCFKLQKPSLRQHSSNTRPACLEDVRKGYNNLFYNPEEGCCVLQVTSSHFASTSPHVMGQLLTAVHMTLSHNFRNQRLRLSFDSNWVRENSASVGHAFECVLDPAIVIRIFHWWDPKYPFPT